MKLTFSRIQRILSRDAFKTLYARGRKVAGERLVCYYRWGEDKNPKLGITVSRKWGKAHKRNRFKRIVREGYRHLYADLPSYLELNIHPRTPLDEVGAQEIEKELKRLINKICGNAQPQSKKSGSNH